MYVGIIDKKSTMLDGCDHQPIAFWIAVVGIEESITAKTNRKEISNEKQIVRDQSNSDHRLAYSLVTTGLYNGIVVRIVLTTDTRTMRLSTKKKK